MSEEGLFGLIVPVGLCDGAAAVAGRAMGTAGLSVPSTWVGQILLLVDLDAS